MEWCCLSRSQQKETPYQALTKFLPMQAVGGTTGGWFVIPVRQWYQDCKGLFLYRSEVYVELGRYAKEQICICGTQVSDRQQYWINVQSTCPSCWPIRVPITSCDKQERKQGWKKQVSKVATDVNKAKGITNNRAIECSLYAPFRYLLFSFTIFFCPIFFFCFCSFDIFFSARSTQE